MNKTDLSKLSTEQLLQSLDRVVQLERVHTLRALLELATVDVSESWRQAGSKDLRSHMIKRMGFGLAEVDTYLSAARALLRHPSLAGHVLAGRIEPEELETLAPVMTADNVDDLVNRAFHMFPRDIQAMVRTLQRS